MPSFTVFIALVTLVTVIGWAIYRDLFTASARFE
jgi:hypothetical protein